MITDLTFFTNEENRTIKDRFKILLQKSTSFDCLVGYFFVSGFHEIYPALENTQKIRILIGMGIDPKAFKLIEYAKLLDQARRILFPCKDERDC
ncbi:MAG: hypothetical protein NZ853_01235 [Leptospiraceae bacterium]|nr:hypothetical protein [Leptospiraceae bacterium]MDW7976149.1 hypothetical protein [Leptospiraceae bacterium]